MFLSDFKPELPFERVEPFVLIVMQMTRRTAFLMESIFDDEEPAISVPGGQLEIQHADTKTTMFPEAILSRRDAFRAHRCSFRRLLPNCTGQCSRSQHERATIHDYAPR
jgi:hypothetical protein